MAYSHIDLKICHSLVKHALGRGYRISVNDGEELVLPWSTDEIDILVAMFSTDADVLIFHDQNGGYIGQVLLIYGNGEDVVCDHSSNDAINSLVEFAETNH